VVGAPLFEPSGGCRAFFKVYQGTLPVYASAIYRIDSQQNRPQGWSMPVGDRGLQLRGDILIKCYHRYSKPLERRETVFSIQFHTCAITSHTLLFYRQELDDACRGNSS
jgi:tensin